MVIRAQANKVNSRNIFFVIRHSTPCFKVLRRLSNIVLPRILHHDAVVHKFDQSSNTLCRLPLLRLSLDSNLYSLEPTPRQHPPRVSTLMRFDVSADCLNRSASGRSNHISEDGHVWVLYGPSCWFFLHAQRLTSNSSNGVKHSLQIQ